MMIGSMTFGILVGLTAAALAVISGGGVVAALLAYSTTGALGLLSMALFDPWSA